MAYLGRPGATAPLTSADIPDDSITAAKIVDGAVTSDLVYLENATTTQNLSGTYSTERMYLNDSYTLTGDVTITGHLALGTIADEDVIITQDSTERTITGSGTLESGELLSSKETDLTGMTGELGSVVTGSPNLNLSNATFPTQRKIGMFSRFLDAASGTQQIFGIGFQPKFIEFTGAVDNQLSVFHGWADLINDNQHWVGNRPSASNDWVVDQTVDLSLYLVGDGSANNCQQGKVTATDSDSFTITWTKFGAPSSGLTMKIIYRAYRY